MVRFGIWKYRDSTSWELPETRLTTVRRISCRRAIETRRGRVSDRSSTGLGTCMGAHPDADRVSCQFECGVEGAQAPVQESRDRCRKLSNFDLHPPVTPAEGALAVHPGLLPLAFEPPAVTPDVGSCEQPAKNLFTSRIPSSRSRDSAVIWQSVRK